jgi:hypothetical protein
MKVIEAGKGWHYGRLEGAQPQGAPQKAKKDLTK